MQNTRNHSLCLDNGGLCPGWKLLSTGDWLLWGPSLELWKRKTSALAPFLKGVRCAIGSPTFQGVGYPEKKPLYNSDCDGRDCRRPLLLFLFPHVIRPVPVWWELGVGNEWEFVRAGTGALDTRNYVWYFRIWCTHHTMIIFLYSKNQLFRLLQTCSLII